MPPTQAAPSLAPHSGDPLGLRHHPLSVRLSSAASRWSELCHLPAPLGFTASCCPRAITGRHVAVPRSALSPRTGPCLHDWVAIPALASFLPPHDGASTGLPTFRFYVEEAHWAPPPWRAPIAPACSLATAASSTRTLRCHWHPLPSRGAAGGTILRGVVASASCCLRPPYAEPPLPSLSLSPPHCAAAAHLSRGP